MPYAEKWLIRLLESRIDKSGTEQWDSIQFHYCTTIVRRKFAVRVTAELYEIYESESSYTALIWGDCIQILVFSLFRLALVK
jgi:hypothetical protein